MIHKDLTNPDYCEWTRFLQEAESWTGQEIAVYQSQEVQRIIHFAYEKSLGYRRMYQAAGIKPNDVKGIADMGKVPFLTRAMLQEHGDALTVPSDESWEKLTGGSSGHPITVRWTPKSFARELASKAHQYRRIGWREGDKQLVLRQPWFASENYMRFWPEFNELRCSIFHLTPEIMNTYYQAALEFKPKWLKCHPSAGHIFARFLEDIGGSLPSVRGVLCASELLLEHQKEYLSEIFDCRVFSHYGQNEFGAMAGFCEHTDVYHVLPQYGYAELVRPDGTPAQIGEIGEIVATSFIADGTPIIRYRTEDFAELKGWSCPRCGRPYQLWRVVTGRKQDFFVSTSGRLVSILALNMRKPLFKPIHCGQFHQREPGKVTFYYVPLAPISSDVLEQMRHNFLKRLGEGFDLKMAEVESISPTGRGKRPFLVQELEISL